MPINLGRKQLPYLALKGAMALPADTGIQNIESIQERETADEEDSVKFPIGRTDFDSKCIFTFTQKLFNSGKELQFLYSNLIKIHIKKKTNTSCLGFPKADEILDFHFTSIIFSPRWRKHLLYSYFHRPLRIIGL